MKKSPLVKYIIWSTAAFLVFICFLSHDSVFNWVSAGFTLHRQNRQIERYKTEIADLDARINSLSTQKDTLEKYARENFLFAAPGDDVYLVK